MSNINKLFTNTLVNENGQLNEWSIGWSAKDDLISNISGRFLRKKMWNYWCVTSSELLFSATISHIDYAAVLFVYIFDRHTHDFHEETLLIPFGKGVHMPQRVRETITYSSRNMTLAFIESTEKTRIEVTCPSFGAKGSLKATIVIERDLDMESLNVVIPWSSRHFQFTSKQPALQATGDILWAEQRYTLAQGDGFACLDFGRGVWKYRSKWNWGSASGMVNKKQVGINLGGQWTDGTGQNENGVIVDGKLYKIDDDIEWFYDRTDYLKKWEIKAAHVDLTFEPIFERKAETNAFIIQSSVHQLFGYYSGEILLGTGEIIRLERLFGWAEDHVAKW
ncbi:DUF2804 domain-containing protein [Alkalihalobacillus sp. LMS6]|uniref:DUF2804 domain-containing protein n=1 Tax=Alkalihalobacillus sp. LMS6 TaxID=2924034 RepID=UPI0020D1A5A5|nr:DUF2804 domain-containing protein [Alkalihalobacillus sp. LMS6]UTR06441.1 DUF2804 domain-containing protein [Alkalihalobacillus sp. LMS6]